MLPGAPARQACDATSHASFATAIDHAPMGMSLVDPDGTYLHANAAFLALLGYSREELVGRSARDVTVPEDALQDEARVQQMVADGHGVSRREKRYVRADGSTVAALVTTSFISGQGAGRPLLLSQIESIEERRAAETRLLEVQSAHDGIVSIDAEGRVTAWNLGAERLFGHPATTMLGQRLERIIPAELLGRHDAGVRRAVRQGMSGSEGGTTELPAIGADGRRILVEASLSSWSQQGRTGFTAVLRDVTARRRTELLTGLTRHAAGTANQAPCFATATREILEQVCAGLGWVAAHARTQDSEKAVWAVTRHEHAEGAACALAGLADAGAAPPGRGPAPGGSTVAVGSAGPSLPCGAGCGVGSAFAVPVLTGGQAVGLLEFYLPAGAEAPDDELVGALEQIGIMLGQVVEREHTVSLLRHQADHDPLTDLANRRLLLQEISILQASLENATAQAPAALLLLDLDRFGMVNSSLGYAAGDLVLQEAAHRLRAACRPSDLVGRLGGDEFVVLARGLTADGPDHAAAAAAVGQRLLDVLSAPFQVAGQQLSLRASVGVCPIGPDHAAVAHYPAAVLRDADAALRHAKRRGKARVEVFDAAMRSDAARRLTDELALAEAIATGALVVHYQPIVDLESGAPLGAEALVRWPRPGHGLVPPNEFIPLAETSGLIMELGRWVLHRACSDAARWAQDVPALASGSISVNTSVRQLAHPRFVEDVDAALAASGLPAERLIIEITESALIEDRNGVLEVLGALRHRGVRLALDDFGTGYSSLGYVHTLPVDILKIDKSFIDQVTGPGMGTALSEVVLKLAAVTGLRTVAEGVESPAQAAAMRGLGCHAGQGYTWSRPVPAEELAVLLRRPLPALAQRR